MEMLPSVTASVCRQTVARDSNNSFGIRSLEDDGCEYFGWGVWPEASFFNHSCQPNVGKRRVGREWQFWAARDIECGEELLISYLGGDEEDLDHVGRRDRLRVWGFDCSCSRCAESVDCIDGDV
jgi:SET and MYND domain-containing protein